jgi:hypothetical protein
VFVKRIAGDVLSTIRNFVFGPTVKVSNLKMVEIAITLAGIELHPRNFDGWVLNLAKQKWPTLLPREKLVSAPSGDVREVEDYRDQEDEEEESVYPNVPPILDEKLNTLKELINQQMTK